VTGTLAALSSWKKVTNMRGLRERTIDVFIAS